MDINLVIGGARRLSIDVANLSFRVAMLESEREAMTELVMQLTPGFWERSYLDRPPGSEGGPERIETTEVPWVKIQGEQVQMLDRLIVMFHDLA
jgi:hypothetical protein